MHGSVLTGSDRRHRAGWGALALLFALIAAVLGIVEAYDGLHVVQDDARQHVVWLLRYVDPTLFPEDPIADYFLSVGTPGYKAVYWLGAQAGIDALTFAKLLPAVLLVVSAWFAFLLGARLFDNLPAAGFFVAWVVVQNAALMDNLSSATPRAFLYPLFLAFLWALVSQRAVWAGTAALALGLFYPQMALVAGGIAVLRLVTFAEGRMRLAPSRAALTGMIAAGISLVPYLIGQNPYGPVITPEQAGQLPEFGAGQRAAFFDDDLYRFLSCGERSGIFPIEWCRLSDLDLVGIPVTLGPILLLLVVLWVPIRHWRQRSGPMRIDPAYGIVPRWLLVSFGLYVAAHVMLFELHLPNRYTQHSLRLAFDIALGYLLFLAASSVWHRRSAGARLAGLALGMLIVGFPFLAEVVGSRGYVARHGGGVYEAIADLPIDARVASFLKAADNIPAFSRRSVVTSEELGIPYHLGYYLPYRARTRLLAVAQYATDPVALRRALDTLDFDYWLVRRHEFTADGARSAWWGALFPDLRVDVVSQLDGGARPVLPNLLDECGAWQSGSAYLLDVTCLRETLEGVAGAGRPLSGGHE